MVGEPEVDQKRASSKLTESDSPANEGLTIPLAESQPERDRKDHAGNWLRNSPNLAVALNCGTGSSFLNALVNAFERLHSVRCENSGNSGSKYRRCTSGRRLRGASRIASMKAEEKISLASPVELR